MKLKQVLFSSDRLGYALFENAPVNGKCGLYHFSFNKNKGRKDNEVILAMVTTLAFGDAVIGLENEKKRYFLYSNYKQVFSIGDLKKHDMIEVD